MAKAVQMTIRIDPDVKKLILGNPKGARAYVESLVNEEAKSHGLLAAEKFMLMQERQAHARLKEAQCKLLEQQKIYAEALREIAAFNPGAASQMAEEALVRANRVLKLNLGE